MPTAKIYRNGISLSNPHGNPNPPKRGFVTGWSRASARRHTQFLMSVDSDCLSGGGHSFTLTLRDCPPSADLWKLLVQSLLERFRRSGAIRWHWVIEWQRRGVPHLHGCVWWPKTPPNRGKVDFYLTGKSSVGPPISWWVDIASAYVASPVAQNSKPIDGVVGWLKYLSKHAARGVSHYQRAGRPSGWDSTGRLWGRGGDWPVVEVVLADDLSMQQFWRFRRLVRSYCKDDVISRVLKSHKAPVGPKPRRRGLARKNPLKEISSIRRMLRCGDRYLSEVRGLSYWCPDSVSYRFLDLL